MKIKNFDLLKEQDIQIRNIRRGDLDQIMKWYNNAWCLSKTSMNTTKGVSPYKRIYLIFCN
jgi:hypothetical protein